MIIPALLTTNPRIAAERIQLAQSMSGWLHIDMLDNSLYDFTSLSVEALKECDFGNLELEIHAMVDDPVAIAQAELPISRLIMHYETPDWEEKYYALLDLGINAWLAVDPETKIDRLALPDDVGGVVVMGVTPGQTGQDLLPETYDRLDLIKDFWPDMPVAIDGGVRQDNLRRLVAHGADNLIMGSGLFETPNPVEMYQRLVEMADPLHQAQRVES